MKVNGKLFVLGATALIIGFTNSNHPYDFILCFIGGFLLSMSFDKKL